MFPLDSLSIEQLTLKTVTLLALISGHRVETFAKIKISNITEYEDRIEIRVSDKIKTTKINSFQPVIIAPFFKEKPALCLASAIKQYIQITSPTRNFEDYLILTHRKPIHKASKQTISRWLKQMLAKSGINVAMFSSHSVRHASTSAARRGCVNIEEIRKRAGWTTRSVVFNVFYNKPLVTDPNAYALGVLNASHLG